MKIQSSHVGIKRVVFIHLKDIYSLYYVLGTVLGPCSNSQSVSESIWKLCCKSYVMVKEVAGNVELKLNIFLPCLNG